MTDEAQKIEITIKDVELVKLNLNPGEILAMIVKSDDMDGQTIGALKSQLSKVFPDNKVLIFGIGLGDSLSFGVISENKELSSCATSSYCVDCGKKEKV